ncbi:MAG TPA: hypothetical protein VGH52_01780 [Gaiellaceae bacterium]
MTLHSLRGHSLYVAPIRVALGLVWVVAARIAGASSTSVWLAAATAVFAMVFLYFNDPRARFLPRRGEVQPFPEDGVIASPAQQAFRALFPSTIGVSVLAAIAVVPRPVLAAFLGGISAGLGVAGVVGALRTAPDLYYDPRRGTLYRREA